MWEISNNTQLYSFLISCLFGIGYCIFYDMFRAIRKVKKHSAVVVFFEDIIYFSIIGIVTFLLQLAFSAGEIRFYLLFGIFLGFLIWNFTVSKFLIRLLVFLITSIIKAYKTVYIFSNKIFIQITAFFAKIALKIKKTLKKSQKTKNKS